MSEAAENNIMAKKVAEAYVDPTDLVLDPEKLDSSILERMPQPTGWRMLVLPYAGKVKNLKLKSLSNLSTEARRKAFKAT